MASSLIGSVDYTQYGNVGLSNKNVDFFGKINEDNAIDFENSEENETADSSSSEQCKDGKDDGKIGFFSAIGNAIKGAAKTVVNGIKGCFTNSEGKFSLGKTLLSLGTVAACVVFPPVGYGLCIAGGVMGAAQVGKGVVGAINAKTDAEAKEAWQNIGGGAVTVGASVAGAKASKSAMIQSAAKSGGSKILGLNKNSTIAETVKAYAHDAITSTKSGFSAVKAKIPNIKQTISNIKNQGTSINTESNALVVSDAAQNTINTELATLSNASAENGFVDDIVVKNVLQRGMSRLKNDSLISELNLNKEDVKRAVDTIVAYNMASED